MIELVSVICINNFIIPLYINLDIYIYILRNLFFYNISFNSDFFKYTICKTSTVQMNNLFLAADRLPLGSFKN